VRHRRRRCFGRQEPHDPGERIAAM
jgi:hypothetical protein